MSTVINLDNELDSPRTPDDAEPLVLSAATPLPKPGAARFGNETTSNTPYQRDLIAGLLAPFAGRGRFYLAGLVEGLPSDVAMVRAGIRPATLQRWLTEDAEYREAVDAARIIGKAETWESEMMALALDRSSKLQGRALETMLRRHDPEYRDKASTTQHLIVSMEQSLSRLTGGWRQRTIEATEAPALGPGPRRSKST